MMKPLPIPQTITYCIHKPCFGLQANQELTFLPGLQPVKGRIVAISRNGKEMIARYQGPDVELPDGTYTFCYKLIAVML